MSYLDKNILAIIPARGGSKGIYKKNLVKLDGLSLIARAAKICSDLDWIDYSIISSDDEDMIKEGVKFGLDAPFKRPKKLSNDTASAIDVWKHAFIESEKYYNKYFDITILLEPSSPFRKANYIEESVEKLIKGCFDSLLTISETDSKSHPLKQLEINGKNIKNYNIEAENIVFRQQLQPLYHRNGVCYVLTRDCLLNQESIMGNNPSYLVIKDNVVNIDTPSDLKLAEYYLSDKNGL